MAQKKGWKLQKDSATKMVIWFKDGNVRLFYSIDWRHKLSKTKDKQLGLNRFRRKIKEYGTKAGVIEIYEKETGQRLYKFIEGVEQTIN